MERGTAAQRNKLKDAKRAEQKDLCAECGEKLPPKYCVLDRTYAPAGYVADNTRLIHQECDKVKQQKLHFT